MGGVMDKPDITVLANIDDEPLRAALRFRCWVIPQVPGRPFVVQTETLAQARAVEYTLAHFMLFMLRERVMPDYSNATSIEVWDGDGDWECVEDYETEDDL